MSVGLQWVIKGEVNPYILAIDIVTGAAFQAAIKSAQSTYQFAHPQATMMGSKKEVALDVFKEAGLKQGIPLVYTRALLGGASPDTALIGVLSSRLPAAWIYLAKEGALLATQEGRLFWGGTVQRGLNLGVNYTIEGVEYLLSGEAGGGWSPTHGFDWGYSWQSPFGNYYYGGSGSGYGSGGGSGGSDSGGSDPGQPDDDTCGCGV
jgi:hypothetical protein